MNLSKPVVLYLIDTLQTGGAEKSLFEITSRFQSFCPVFVTLFEGRHDLLQDYELAGIKVIRLGLPVSNRFLDIAKKVDLIINEERALIVHSSIFRSDMVARKLKSKVKIVNSLVNNSYRMRRYEGLNWRGKLSLVAVQLIDRFTIHRIDLMIANSRVLIDSHQKTIGLNPMKAKVIHRGRAIPDIQRKQKSKPGNSVSWLFVARLIERKGHRDLLNAFSELLKIRPDDKLIFAGDGNFKQEIVNSIQKLGMSDNVDVLGTINNVNDLLSNSDFFIFPSYFEGLPGSLIEAMMAKIPIICSDIQENKECVDESMCLFHRVGEPTDILTQMKKALVLDDWEKRTERAFNFAIEHFEIGKVVRQYEETYEHLLKHK